MSKGCRIIYHMHIYISRIENTGQYLHIYIYTYNSDLSKQSWWRQSMYLTCIFKLFCSWLLNSTVFTTSQWYKTAVSLRWFRSVLWASRCRLPLFYDQFVFSRLASCISSLTSANEASESYGAWWEPKNPVLHSPAVWQPGNREAVWHPSNLQ